MPVEVRAAQRRVRLDLRRIRRQAEFLLERVDRGGQVLSILITDDRQMAALRERWTGEEGPTDVLSFPMEEQGILGDIVISAETAARRGRTEQEILRYLVHGILHLTGRDHRTRAQRQRMDRLARRLICELERPRQLASGTGFGARIRAGFRTRFRREKAEGRGGAEAERRRRIPTGDTSRSDNEGNARPSGFAAGTRVLKPALNPGTGREPR